MTLRMRFATRLTDQLRHSVYGGQVVVFRNVPEMWEVTWRTQALLNVRAGSAPVGPKLDAWQAYFAAGGAEAITEACNAFESDPDIVNLMRTALVRCGCGSGGGGSSSSVSSGGSGNADHSEHDEQLWDRVRLRVQAYGDAPDNISNTARYGTGRYSTSLPLHRDTCVAAQGGRVPT